ncbi:MAG: hypothetical protein MUC49_02180 [Raineya sp.]|jgi:hypothetical protein|nr:hypothetical protein [Raineya sp.]
MKNIKPSTCIGCEFLKSKGVVYGHKENQYDFLCTKSNKSIAKYAKMNELKSVPSWCEKTIDLHESISWRGKYYQFESVIDLSKGVNFRPLDDEKKEEILKNPHFLSYDTANFIVWWVVNHKPKIPHFRGMNNVNFCSLQDI